MIPIQQALDAVSTFASQDVVSVMPNNVEKFLAYAAIAGMRGNVDKFLTPYESILTSLGIMNENHDMINEAALKNVLSEAFSNMPSVTWMGFTFTAADAEKLYRRMGI